VPTKLLAGSPNIVETICKLNFQISPNAFFQVNTITAERLYSLVRMLAVSGEAGGKEFLDHLATQEEGTPMLEPPVNTNISIVDVCCGTGTIGLICSPFVRHVVGVDLVEDAIVDARNNAALNGITNSTFFAGKAEETIDKVVEAGVSRVDGGSSGGSAAARVVAIVDPPRAGLHVNVIHAIRTSKHIKRLVYVSCNPTGSLIEDVVRFCSKQHGKSLYARGPEFKPVFACPVDLFPHTAHCEMVVLLERN
jgi:tRNA (uracil-5-)-methyltransferase